MSRIDIGATMALPWGLEGLLGLDNKGISRDNRLINGHNIDMSSTEGAFYAGLWGHNVKDQDQRRVGLGYLDHLAGDGFEYNMEDPEQAAAFVRDIADGSLDGKAGQADGSIMFHGGKVTVGHGAATYDLANPEDYARFRLDAMDGKLDGHAPGGKSTMPASNGSVEGSGGGNGSGNSGGYVSSGSSGTSGSSGSSSSPSKGVAKLNSMTIEQLMDKIRKGELPDEIANDPKAMQALTVRMQDYQRMMDMLTNMMKMLHDISMKIIGNIR
jgi:hypothetical protein